MRHSVMVLALISGFGATALHATDVANRDKKAYTLRVQGEGKLSISTYQIKPGASLYGLCGYSFCTFEIPGSKATAQKDGKLVIQDGKIK